MQLKPTEIAMLVTHIRRDATYRRIRPVFIGLTAVVALGAMLVIGYPQSLWFAGGALVVGGIGYGITSGSAEMAESARAVVEGRPPTGASWVTALGSEGDGEFKWSFKVEAGGNATDQPYLHARPPVGDEWRFETGRRYLVLAYGSSASPLKGMVVFTMAATDWRHWDDGVAPSEQMWNVASSSE